MLQNLEKYRVLWTDFSASCREINQFSVSKIGLEQAKPTISLALVLTDLSPSFLAYGQFTSANPQDLVIHAAFRQDTCFQADQSSNKAFGAI